MPKARNPNRDKALEIWLANTNITIKEIASMLGETESTIRKWKSADQWERAPKNAPKKRSNKRSDKKPKKRGAPKGNQNAKGHTGGAPEGNTNALKHGGYAAIKHDTCDEVERELMDDMPIDAELLLLDQIREYAVRERRLQHLIQACKTGTLEIKEQWEENTALSKLAGEEGKGIKQLKESGYARRERLEQELTSVQRAKNKAIDSLIHLRKIAAERDTDAVIYRMEYEDMDEIERDIYGTDS